jgi:hypothetical protein
MSDMQDTVVEAPPEPVVTDPPPAPDPEPVVETQRFDNPDTMWKSYREAEAAKTRAEQRAAELERQQAEYSQQDAYQDPWDALPPSIDEATQQQIAAYAQRDPAGAAQWAYENHATVGQEVAGQLFQYWQSRDFWGAENWKAQIINQQYYAQMEEKIRAEFEPVRQHTTKQMSELTLSLAQQMIPDWEVWGGRIADFLNEMDADGRRVNQVWMDHLNAAGISSEKAAERLYDLYGMLYTRDQRARGAQNGNATAPPPAPSAQTETTSSSPARDDNGRFTTQTTTTPSSGRRTGRLDHL